MGLQGVLVVSCLQTVLGVVCVLGVLGALGVMVFGMCCMVGELGALILPVVPYVLSGRDKEQLGGGDKLPPLHTSAACQKVLLLVLGPVGLGCGGSGFGMLGG